MAGSLNLYPVAIDPVRRHVWHGENGNVHRTDRDTLADDDVSATLPSFSGSALAVDAVAGKLYYRGQLNTVRVIDVDLTDALEIIPEDDPSINRDIGLYVPPPLPVPLEQVVTLPPGDPDCPDGGLRVELGDDDGQPGGVAFNGELEPEEVDTSVNVCGADMGTSCTTTDNAGGTYTLTCPDGISVTLSDGADGVDGADGTNGSNGTSGDAGSDGTSCTVTQNDDGSATISCDDGTSANVSGGGGCAQTGGSTPAALLGLLLGFAWRRRRR